MGLKFQRDDSLDRRFDDFAFLPNDLDLEKEKTKAVDIERFLKADEQANDAKTDHK